MDKEPDHHLSLRAVVERALKEDIGRGDLTSLACLEPAPVKGAIIAKSGGVLSGLKPALTAFDIVDSANIVRPLKVDGDSFQPGDVIIEIEGFNQTVLATERTALNFLGKLSGIATLTHRFVEKVKGASCMILDTRKTTPGLRALEKAAVVHGGGMNHRFGLYDMILIKDNHIASAGSVSEVIKLTNAFLDTADFRLQFDLKKEAVEIEIEISTESQLREALAGGAKRLLLDNQSPQSLANLVKIARSIAPDVKLEASGNVNLSNVAEIAATGVDFISIGSLTHSAPSSDFSLDVTSE